jgi:hypothetical protein
VPGVIIWGAVLEMLEDCAPTFSARIVQHRRLVMFNGKTYRSIRLGEHSDRKREKGVEIPLGKVEGLVRHLEIDKDCAKSKLPQLRF